MTPEVQYGNWFHQFLSLILKTDRSLWEPVFQHSLKYCNDKRRAKFEWELFLHSSFLSFFLLKTVTAKTEIRLSEGNSFYRPDTLLLHSDRYAYVLVDWKTGCESPKKAKKELKTYFDQTDRYQKSIERLTKAPIVQTVYLSRFGLWFKKIKECSSKIIIRNIYNPNDV